jgi:hypothetical protein
MAPDGHPPTPTLLDNANNDAGSQSEQKNGPEGRNQPAPSRSELLNRARTFLNSSQVRHDSVAAKRAFLVDKGLSQAEIDEIMYELVSSVHVCAVYAHSVAFVDTIASSSLCMRRPFRRGHIHHYQRQTSPMFCWEYSESLLGLLEVLQQLCCFTMCAFVDICWHRPNVTFNV